MNPTLDIEGLNTRIGRLFMAGMPGPELDSGTEALIRDYGLGGIIFFSRNIQNPIQLATLCRDLQERALHYNGIPLFLAVDQEGGRVARLRAPFTEFPGQAAIGSDPNPENRAREFAETTAREMTMVGLNMDLTPVVDVPRGTPESHLRGRTFSEDVERVALLGCTVIRELQGRGVMAVAKHFPGLGAATLDPHKKLPRIRLPLEEMERVDLRPFRAAVDAAVTGVMSSHAVYPSLDPGNPATLSGKILTGLLRERLGFDGVIITDDLEMGAISLAHGVTEGAVKAFEAGADILLICGDQQQVLDSLSLLRERLITGDISPDRFWMSLNRIARAKSLFLEKKEAVSLEAVRAYFG